MLIAFLFLTLSRDGSLRIQAARALTGAAGHIDSSIGISGDVERDAEPTSKPIQKKTKRLYISPFTKKQVAARQDRKCACGCGKKLSALYELDHIAPLWKGGGNGIENLQCLNPECHMAKTINENSSC